MAIEISNLSLCYSGAKPLFSGLSFAVKAGEFVGIMGDSGCGKSSLLHCMCGLIPSSIPAEITGEILLFGQPVTHYPRHELVKNIGIVFQNPDTQLFCDTVQDEIAFGMENICLPPGEMQVVIADMLAVTGLERHRLTRIKTLSGGQKQLVVLAAVMALRPKVLLLDEAFSQLDGVGKSSLLGRILQLKQRGTTIVMVDHDEKNLQHVDRLVCMGNLV